MSVNVGEGEIAEYSCRDQKLVSVILFELLMKFLSHVVFVWYSRDYIAQRKRRTPLSQFSNCVSKYNLKTSLIHDTAY